MKLRAVFYVFFTLLSLLPIPTGTQSSEQRCLLCEYLVKSFEAGKLATEKAHFAGGNTDWEERNLGRYATSETRFLEVLDHTCKKESIGDASKYSGLKELNFHCHNLLEEYEEVIEDWFRNSQDTAPNLYEYLCVQESRRCCLPGHFGKLCDKCPGVAKNAEPCFGRGKCDGAGLRIGSGKCTCEKGYSGPMCSNCDAHYFAVSKTDTSIECRACFDGCASGCTDESSKGCLACRTGYSMDDTVGCKDVDECSDAALNNCQADHEVCINTNGSYYCECSSGYRRNTDSNKCEIDFEADAPVSVRPDRRLWIFCNTAFVLVGIFIYFHPTRARYVIFFVAAAVMVFINFCIDIYAQIDDNNPDLFEK